MSKLRTGRMLGRSRGGNFVMFFLLFVSGAFMILPILYSILQSLKPLNEINLFPPRFFVTQPTFSNYRKLLNLSANLWVPFSRYIFNSFFISITVTLLSVLISVFSGVAGLCVSVPLGCGVGAAVVLCAAVCYAASLLLGRALHVHLQA